MFGNADSTIILSAEERIVIISSGIFVKILCVGFTMNYIRKIESLDIQGSLFFAAVRPGGRPLQQYTASEISHPFHILCIDPFLPFMIK